ncbi:MAG: hypothetical protein HRU24_09520 [Gammaproteobacteria bacterium]|nr:hypothetical protein [Gammaproteobacteria bacterium]
MSRLPNKIFAFVFGLLLPLASILPAQADDIEIFTIGGNVKPKILMILDTSSSMTAHVSGGENRFTVLKKAMDQFISNVKGVEVGLMRLNQQTGAVIFPISDLGQIITEKHGSLNRPITANHNNGHENIATGVMTIDHAGGSLPINAGNLIGLRFTNITIPKNSYISKASLEMFPVNPCRDSVGYTIACPRFYLTIYGDKQVSSPKFSLNNRDISLRTPTSATSQFLISDWSARVTNFYQNPLVEKPIVTPDLSNIITEIISQTGWKSGNSLSLIVNTTGVDNAVNSAGFKNVARASAPVLFIEFKQRAIGGARRSAVTRHISTKDKLLEALAEQTLNSHTAIVPALFEATKYLRGSALASPNNATLNTTRSANVYNTIFKINERVAHQYAIKDGVISYPTGCNAGNLNSYQCRGVTITGNTPKYVSPLTGTCDKTANEASIILLTDGEATSSSTTIWGNIQTDIASFLGISACTTSGADNYANAQTCGVELATQLRAGVLGDGEGNSSETHKVKLYTIGFNNADSWLEKLARQGQTVEEMTAAKEKRYYTATNSADLIKAFEEITTNIIEGATTFSNSSASINTSNQLSHNDKVFFALFEPNKKSSWPGNLKRYQLKSNGGIYDNSSPQIKAIVDGQFVTGAKSWWSNHADGAVITAGGARDALATQPRNIYSNLGFKKSTVSKNLVLTKLSSKGASYRKLKKKYLGVNTKAKKKLIVDWMLNDKNIADPLHSTPTEVSYPNNDSVIFFGDNQGYLHAIDSETGSELYAFMPGQLLINQKEIKAGQVRTTASNQHIYGMDGEITIWNKSDSEKYLYTGMRRGGSYYYAFDISNRAVPTLKWIISPKTLGFEKLGQTWSKPIKVKMKIGGASQDVLIFAGGYDKDQDNYLKRHNDNKGSEVFIVAAETGKLLWSTSSHTKNPKMKYSIPSDIKAIDIDGDDNVDQMYVGDMGGQVWRFDVAPSDSRQSISYARIADLSVTDSNADNRRFYHAPDVSLIKGLGNATLAVAIGSGYRAHPNNNVINDNFYMLKQPLYISSGYDVAIEQADLYNATANTIGDGSKAQATLAKRELANASGWFVALDNDGEKVLASSLTFDHAVWFTTYSPSIDASGCAISKGTARLYRVNIEDATPNFKRVVPDNPDDATLDLSNSCDQANCDKSDRSKVLKNPSLPSRPALLNIGGNGSNSGTTADPSKRILCIGLECYPASNNKSTMMFWIEE